MSSLSLLCNGPLWHYAINISILGRKQVQEGTSTLHNPFVPLDEIRKYELQYPGTSKLKC